MQTSIPAFTKKLDAEPHTPIYMMHKYFARRPWNVFRELIANYTSPNETILDPFCGGGVTVVEALKLRRKVIGADLNPLATYVTRMEVTPVDLGVLQQSMTLLSQNIKNEIESLYATTCAKCNSKAFADWIEWDEASKQIRRLKFACPVCGFTGEKPPERGDIEIATRLDKDFADYVKERKLWYPPTEIMPGDKTESLLTGGIKHFHELFTRRNLLALALLRTAIQETKNPAAREFLNFTFSSSLKWSSRQSHLRNQIVEGWAMHAYWIYPKSLEINVWNTFERRFEAVLRGKKYGNREIGKCAVVGRFDDLRNAPTACFILTASSDRLPLPNASIDAVITDPPYGGNVNYAELSDYWVIWNSNGNTVTKKEEAIINKTRNKTLTDYQNALYNVFRECHRVLKSGKVFVSTFNSKDLRVVASFVTAASQAGFTLHPNGLLYQRPIRAYTTTFHAMQVGAFVGDFIFTFVKENGSEVDATLAPKELSEYKSRVSDLIDKSINRSVTEPEIREKAYCSLIPFVSKYATVASPSCNEAVDFFEQEMEQYDTHFKKLRQETIEKRRSIYSSKNSKPNHANQRTLD